MNSSSSPVDAVCYTRSIINYRGVFFGDSPFAYDTSLLLAQLSLCSFVTNIMQCFLMPLGQSAFLSQILAGLLLGPSIIGSNKTFSDIFFPVSSFYVIDTFSFFGVMLFLFIIGVKTDLKLVQKSGKKAVAIGVCAFMTPLILNSIVAQMVTHSTAMEPRLHRSILWIASFQALSSSHVIICLLADLKLMNSELGRLAISSSMVSGICSAFWSFIVFTGKQSAEIKTKKTFLLMFIFLGFIVLLTVYVFRPIILWMIPRIANEKSVKESHICIIFILLLVSSLLSEFFGQHFLFGPVLLGMVIPDGPPLGSALVTKLESFITSVILPIFFVVSGARLDFSVISPRNVAIIGCLAFFALACKVAGVMLPSLYYKMPFRDALHLGLILGNQGIVEVILLERARASDLIDKQSFSIMVLLIAMFTGILAPIVKFFYDPSKRYATGVRMSIQHANSYSELRILACVHYQEQTPSVINLFEASYPHPQRPICFYVVHLIDLAGRSAPVFVAHQPGIRNPSSTNESDHIINALRFFEHEHMGNATVYPFTAISPYASMHTDVCSLAAERSVSLVVLLFHKHPEIHVSESEANAIRAMNQLIIKQAPCSVGILIDRGAMMCNSFVMSQAEIYRIGVIFLGGPDDREALAYACMMAKHPNILLTLIHFLGDDTEGADIGDIEQDAVMINKYRETAMNDSRCIYQEESVNNSMGFINVVRSTGSCFDLIVVGRRHAEESPLLAGLSEWNEFPELGYVGDMIVALEDLDERVSILVVQQALSSEDVLDNYEHLRSDSSRTDVQRSSGNRVWPAPGSPS